MRHDSRITQSVRDAVLSYRGEILEFTKELVAVPTENPPGTAYGSCLEVLAHRLREIGLENVAGQIKKLRTALVNGLRALGIPTKTPVDAAGPMVVVKSANAEALAARLAERNIITAAKFDGLRIAFHVYNTLDDVDAVLEALEENLGLAQCRSLKHLA